MEYLHHVQPPRHSYQGMTQAIACWCLSILVACKLVCRKLELDNDRGTCLMHRRRLFGKRAP
eukprot:1037452-Alexandrium_andersonii.AAC.1